MWRCRTRRGWGWRQEHDLMSETVPPIAEPENWGAVESQAAIRWNDPRHPQAQESFGAVPAVAPVVGGPHS
jgi:hypothetical protein